jgi:hypothetical protein
VAEGAIEAVGGALGGAGTPSGQLVVVRYEDGVVEVFTETDSSRFHARLIGTMELRESPAPGGESLVIEAARQGAMIPVRFAGEERAALERIIAAVRAAG